MIAGGPHSRIGADLFSVSFISTAVLIILLVLVFGILRCIPVNFELEEPLGTRKEQEDPQHMFSLQANSTACANPNLCV